MYTSYIKSKLQYEYVFWNYYEKLGQMPIKLYLINILKFMSVCFDTSRYTKLPHTFMSQQQCI